MRIEYVDGGSIQELVKKRELDMLALAESEVLDIVVQTALALKYCHERRVLHRDIKPGNMMYSRDRLVKLIDFGMSKALEEGRDM